MNNFSNIARKCFDDGAYTLFIERSPEQKNVVKKKPAESFEQSMFITRPTVESLTPYYAQYTNGLFDDEQHTSWLARIVWVMDDIATGIKRHILPGDINTINVLLDVFNQPLFEEITGLPISFDTELGKITITDRNEIKLDFIPLSVEPSIVQEKAQNFIRLLKELPLENLQKNCVLGLMRRYLEASGALNELKAPNKSFSRIARKYFADEQPKEAEKAEQPEQSAEKKSEPAKDELLELLKHVQEHGLQEKMNNQQFFDANKKLFMDKFLMNGEKKRTPKEFMDAVREYGKDNNLEGVVRWILDGKTDGLKSDKPAEKSNKVVEESSKQASDKTAASESSSDKQSSDTKTAQDASKATPSASKGAVQEKTQNAKAAQLSKKVQAVLSREDDPKVQRALKNNDLTVAQLQGFVDVYNKARKTGNNVWQMIKYEFGPQTTIDFFKSLKKAYKEGMSERRKLRNEALNEGWMD